MPAVSILIAAYNVELYLERCLESAVHQTLKDIEIIVVDDGSTDGTPEIAQRYASSDPRVKLVRHDVNCGLLWVRKSGIEAASAKYVTFLDGDDDLSAEACEKMLAEAVRSGADLVCVSRVYIGRNGNLTHYVDELKYGSDSEGLLQSLVRRDILNSVTGKLFEKRIFEESGIEFYKHLNNGEDQVVLYQIFGSVRKASCLKDELYNWYFNPKSLCHNGISDLRVSNVVSTFEIVFRGVEGHGDQVKAFVEKNATKSFFNVFKAGYDRKKAMDLIASKGMAYLFDFKHLRKQLGLRKALVYWLCSHVDNVARVLYRGKVHPN